MKNFRKSSLALGIAMAAGSAGIQAQDRAAPILEEIVVTAQKREQALQDVPVSVAVVSGEDLIVQNSQDFEKMADTLPSLNITNVANITAISIRGIGTGDNGGFEQSVGLFIDGVHQPKDRLYRATSFLDVGNVQVLRGPQGTLFGKNTTAGAVMLTSNKPTETFEAGFTATGIADQSNSDGHNGGYSAEFFVSGALSDRLLARLAYRDIQDHGYFTNFIDGQKIDVDDKDQQAIRLSLEWLATDTLSALLKLEKGKSRIVGEPNRTFNYETAYNPALGLSAQNVIDLAAMNPAFSSSPLVEGPYVQSWNTGFDDTDSEAASLTVDWDLGAYNFMSITGYTAFEYNQLRDSDWIAVDLANQDDWQDFESYSQEFRLLSPQGETVEYVVGLYYQSSEDESIEGRNVNASLLQPFVPFVDASSQRYYRNKSESWSLYGNFDIHLADRWTLSLGGNYSYETKEAKRVLTIDGGAAEALTLAMLINDYAHEMSDDRSVNQFTGSARLSYDIADNYMMYGSIAQGFKSGGFDETGNQGDEIGEFNPAAGPAQFEFDDEEVLSYEIGGKGTFLQSRLAANWALFYVDVKDRQFSRYEPAAGFIVGNSGKMNYRGMELETQYLLTENLQWNLQLAYLRGEVVEAIEVPGIPNFEEEGRTNAPEWRATNHLRYDYAFGDMVLRADMWNIYDDDAEFTGANLSRDAEIRTNLRFGLGNYDGNWEVALLADNITNEEVLLTAQANALFPSSATVGTDGTTTNTGAQAWVRQPRTYSLQFRYNF